MANGHPNHAGPLLGASLIGAGIGYFIYKKTGNWLLAASAAIGITLADFAVVIFINRFKNK
ncbi:MAG: hypothetical protein V3U82_00240 [Robiginitomaculum sp.]